MTDTTSPDTAARIRHLLQEHLKVVIESDTQNLFEDLGADSLDAVEIILMLEEEFEIEISDDALNEARTVADVIAIIQKAQLT